MIREIAELTVDPAREAGFLAAVEAAVPLFRGAPGCRAMHLERVIETPGLYRLHVLWDRLEDHTQGFRGSEAFTRWRALAGPFFVAPPRVDHGEAVVAGFARAETAS
jgi:heme-degrading monooxygenase HmoA